MNTTTFARFACVFAVAGFSALSLAACAVDADDGAEPTGETSQALINNGGGPGGHGITCDPNDNCTCSKDIEGDCDSLRDLCNAGSLPGFDTCVGGWLTNACTCHVGLVKKKPPVIGPIFGTSSGVVKAQ